MADMMSLVEGAFNNIFNMGQTRQTQIGQDAQQQQGVLQDMSGQQDVIAGANAKILENVTADRLNLATKLNTAANEIGVNWDPSGMMSQLASQQKDNIARLTKATEEYKQVTQSDITADPMGWVVDQFKQPFVARELGAAQTAVNSTKASIDGLNNTFQNAAQTQDILAKANAKSNFAEELAKINASAQVEKDKYTLEALRTGQVANAQIFQTAIEGERAKVQWGEFAQRQANLEEARAERAQRQRMIDEAKQQELVSMDLARQGLKLLGVDSSQWNNAQMKQFMATQTPESSQTIYAAAFAQPRGQSGIINLADSPAEYLNAKTSFGANIPNTEYLNGYIAEINNSAANDPVMHAQYFTPKGQYKPEAVNSYIAKRLAQDAGNVDPKNGANPFTAATLSNIEKVNPGIANSDIYKKFLINYGDTALKDPTFLMQEIEKKGLPQGVNPTDFAKQLSALYDASMAISNSTNNFATIGLQPQKNYKYDGVVWSDPAQVSREVMKAVISRRPVANTSINPSGTFGFN
jgi:hypothetical protein